MFLLGITESFSNLEISIQLQRPSQDIAMNFSLDKFKNKVFKYNKKIHTYHRLQIVNWQR